jgi:hypothetical protein
MQKASAEKKSAFLQCKKLEKNISLPFCIAKRQRWRFVFP